MTPILKKQLTLCPNIRACCSSTSKHLLEEHFPARIQIFHHADRGGGYSENQRESPSLPPASVLAGPASDPGELSANQCRQRGDGFTNRLTERDRQTDTNRRVCSQNRLLIRKKTPLCIEMEKKITDFSGKWTMKSSENFEELLKALGE